MSDTLPNMPDWLRSKQGEYHSADGTRRLIFMQDMDCWLAVPMHKKPGQAGHKLSDVSRPYRSAYEAGSLDQAPALGDWTFSKADQ